MFSCALDTAPHWEEVVHPLLDLRRIGFEKPVIAPSQVVSPRTKCDRKKGIQTTIESLLEPSRSEGDSMYRHLNSTERSIISLGCLLEKSTREIAFVVGRHHSTIAREIIRGSPDKRFGYSNLIARVEYEKRRRKGGPRRKIQGNFHRWIVAKLKQQWSPEQIVGRAHREGKPCISIETIYRFVYRDRKLGGELWKNLRRCRKKRKPRFPRHTWRKTRPGLDERPLAAEKLLRVLTSP